MNAIDTHGWLNLMWRRWNEVFREKLGHSERSYVSELLKARNDWAHQQAFNNEDAYRVADTATRLLQAVNAPDQEQITQNIAAELLRLRYEAEAKKSRKKTAPLSEAPTTTQRGLKPWRQVVQPHPDVANGRYIQATFAADLAQVVQGKAAAEYGDPKEFFRRTYLTEGLLDLLVTGVRRLTGQGGDPVVQLQTSFGGGKTHSMLALYHLLGGGIALSQIPGGEAIVDRVSDIDDVIEARRAVIVGTSFSPSNPRTYKDVTTNTLWGDIAYQLGGAEAYQLVEQADLTGVNPGSDTLVELFERYGPALIIIDELVAFARNLWGAERLTSGTFDAVMSFMQSLTEAVKRSTDSMLLVSIPESDIEIGGEGGKRTLEILAKTIGRIESVWKPVTPNESFEIVRRQLFSSEIDYAARDAVISAFREMYSSNPGDFPSGSAEGDYTARMTAAYPIHPELFDRLYQDWSTLERFQRTRGVLRLMSSVIHRLWSDNDQSLMIMPSAIPLWSATVRNEMLRYLPENWPAIVDADIDGQDSRPFQLDQSVPTLGQHMACRRVTRAIFVGSAPSVAGQSVRGVEEVRIRLATIQPGEPVAVFGDAIRRMSQHLTYLYTDGSRYWYDTRPTVNRIAQDRAQNIKDDDVYLEIVKRLKAIKFRREDFAAAHVAPQGSGDISDEPQARVVVLDHTLTHKKGNNASKAMQEAKEMIEKRGDGPRYMRNMLVFIAPDENNAAAFVMAVREYLAWQSIEAEEEQLNLDAQQRKQVKSNLKRTEETVDARLQETYSWLLVPVQPDPLGEIVLQPHRISGTDTFYVRASRKLRQSELLVSRWSPDNLRMELDRYLWRNQPHVSIKQLWNDLAQYPYLPRLYDQRVLTDAIETGIQREDDPPFGYATMVGEDGRYKGLVLGKPGQRIYFDDKEVIVKPEVALAQIEAERPALTPSSPPENRGDSGNLGGTTVDTPPQPRLTTRYHGTVSLNPQRANKDMSVIVEEVIQRLTGLTGTDVEITIEISAKRPEGFDDATIRTISENSRTLKFKNHGFEE